jgi:hypothetical protein
MRRSKVLSLPPQLVFPAVRLGVHLEWSTQKMLKDNYL